MRRAVTALALAAACGGPPSDTSFDWRVDLAELDDALLSTCAGGEAIYAVGGRRDRGLALRWDGAAWRAEPLPAGAGVLWWCWVDDAGDAVAVGERATVLRRRGGAWERLPAGDAVDARATLYGVWGASADDFIVVGGDLGNVDAPTAISHFDGTFRAADTAALPPRTLFKVWGAGDGDVWAVGAGGTILRYDGDRWHAAASPTAERLIALWGTGADDIYAVGGDGDGLVLRFDGDAWQPFATAPEELSGVWTAPGRPLYVGGNRGYVARFSRAGGGAADPDARTFAVARGDVCIHALAGTDRAVLAAAADLFGGGAQSWRGALLAHGGRFDGPVHWLDEPDAGAPVDAGPDAGAPVDAGGGDASTLPGPGQECGPAPDNCAPGLDCWHLHESDVFLCTQSCADATACAAYSPAPCCARPNFQTLETVCIPAQHPECQ